MALIHWLYQQTALSALSPVDVIHSVVYLFIILNIFITDEFSVFNLVVVQLLTCIYFTGTKYLILLTNRTGRLLSSNYLPEQLRLELEWISNAFCIFVPSDLTYDAICGSVDCYHTIDTK